MCFDLRLIQSIRFHSISITLPVLTNRVCMVTANKHMKYTYICQEMLKILKIHIFHTILANYAESPICVCIYTFCTRPCAKQRIK